MNPDKHIQHLRWTKSPLAAVAVTTLVTLAISLYCLSSGWFIIFQNLFYIPIIIACIFYTKRGFIFSTALSFLYFFLIVVFSKTSSIIGQALIRVIIFIMIAGVTTFLSLKRLRLEEELARHRDMLEKQVEDRTAALKHTTEEAKRLRQQMEFILGATRTGLAIIDAELNIPYVDPAWQKIYGDPQGRKCCEYFMGRSSSCPNCGVLQALATKQVIVTEENLPKEDGRPVQITAIPFYNDAGDWLVAEVIVDITARKQAEEHLKQVVQELERSNAELEQFAFVASHDLQEPLRLISSYTQLLEKRYKDQLDEKAQTYIQYAVSGANRMQRLIQDMLAYARTSMRETALIAVDTRAAFEEALKHLERSIDESAAVISHNGLPLVMGNHSQLVHVFQNLIGNALKFHGADTPHIHVSAVPDGSEWIFSIRDNGIGIEPQYWERIFDIFKRLHTADAYPGTGIGLALCRRIIGRLGGRIWVESQPGAGSTFRFTLKGA